jgi:sugar/nucleoside kinase (ribokinase family)
MQWPTCVVIAAVSHVSVSSVCVGIVYSALSSAAPAPKDGLDAEFIELADIICPNEVRRATAAVAGNRPIDCGLCWCGAGTSQPETEMLTGMPVESLEQAQAAAQVLLERGAQNVILTLGERGAMLVNAEESGTVAPADKVTAVVRTQGQT